MESINERLYQSVIFEAVVGFVRTDDQVIQDRCVEYHSSFFQFLGNIDIHLRRRCIRRWMVVSDDN